MPAPSLLALFQDNELIEVLRTRKAASCGFSCDDFNDMIQSFSNRKIAQLSGGELRYLEIKLVLCSPSKFVLLDEP
jgi:ABC-type lipopolysaccharide export system ATPase subunit